MSRIRAVADVGAQMVNALQDEGRLLSSVISAVAAELPSRCVLGAVSAPDGEPRTGRVAAPECDDDSTARLQRMVDALLADPDGAVLREDPAVAVQIPVRGRTVGALAVLPATGEPLTADDLEFVEAIASAAGTTLDQARMFADSLQLLEHARRQGDLLDHISDAIVSCDPSGLIVSWNAGAERLYGYPAGEAVGCDLFVLLATTFLAADGTEIGLDDVLAELKRTGTWHGELRERRSDAEPLAVLSAVSALTDTDGTGSGLVLVNRDVTEQRRQEHDAVHDPLTGLPNRRRLINRLRDALERVRQGEGPMAVLFLDLNKFKPINDQYGHAVGDELLLHASRRLLATVRQSDFVARIGGDEFVVLLEKAGAVDRIPQILERIHQALTEPFNSSAATLSVSTSIGVAVVATPADTSIDPERLVQLADEAMYEAKRSGAGTFYADLSA